MQFGYYMPTRIYFGQGCVVQNQAEFAKWGKRALIVTGRNSARVSGALQDVCAALDEQNIAWEIFDQIGENPTFAMVEAGGAAGRKFGPDMVVAIGGGSPLDAAKAIAVLTVNEMTAAKLYDGNYAAEPLPILAVPITAGTGSEVTQYSVLTDAERQTKRGFVRLTERAARRKSRSLQSAVNASAGRKLSGSSAERARTVSTSRPASLKKALMTMPSFSMCWRFSRSPSSLPKTTVTSATCSGRKAQSCKI